MIKGDERIKKPSCQTQNKRMNKHGLRKHGSGKSVHPPCSPYDTDFVYIQHVHFIFPRLDVVWVERDHSKNRRLLLPVNSTAVSLSRLTTTLSEEEE